MNVPYSRFDNFTGLRSQADMAIRPEHYEHYRKHGFAIVEDFLTKDELASAYDDLRTCLPAGCVEYCLNETADKPGNNPPPYRRASTMQFPYPGTALNHITLHPDLREFAAHFTNYAEMYCEQSHLSYKHKGHAGDVEQGMHCDYGNHTLAYPPKLPEYWQTAYLIYYTDVTATHAPTAVCSWEHYPERVRWPAHYSREQRSEIYDNEVKVVVPAGGLLIYSMRTFHRGTAFQDEGGRIAQFVTYAPAAWKWLGIVGWSAQAIRKEFRTWISTATPEERTLLGFPEPGHVYWTEETLEGVSKRYPEMDMSPYEDGVR